jgi:hypothetical protein
MDHDGRLKLVAAGLERGPVRTGRLADRYRSPVDVPR